MKAFQISKSNVFILCLFLLFFPIKTQFYNLTYIVSDAILHSGAVSDIYTYNYLGLLLGCQEILESQKVLGVQFAFFYSLVFYFLYFLSLTVAIILFLRIRNQQNFKKFDWILLVIFSFQLFDSLENVLSFITISGYLELNTILDYVNLLQDVIILIMAFLLFLKVCNPVMRKQISMFALPASLVSFVLWFLFLGSNLLPIITK